MAEPLYSEPQVAPQAAAPGYVQAQSSPQTFGAGVGQALEQAGSVFERAEEEAKNIRVNDQVNQVQEKALDLAYGQDGYRTVLGKNVLKTPSGKPLVQDYSQQFEDYVQNARNQLGNPQQQALFDRRATLIRKNYMRGLLGHDQAQLHAFADETDKATIDTQVNGAVTNWNDPAWTDTAVAGSDAAWASYGQRNGLPANQIQEMQQQSRSGLYMKVLEAQLDAGQTGTASAYLKRYGGDMLGTDAMRAGVLINGKASDDLAYGAVQATTQALKGALATASDPGTALLNAVIKQESGGNPDAVSPKGAKGTMQVMDATNLNPGFGVKPAQDDSPEERARVGRDYLQAMMVRYGDDKQNGLQKGLAAYNAGPGAVDDAVKQAALPANQGAKNPDGSAKTWMDYLPKPQETKPYVANILSDFQKSAAQAPALPSLGDFTNDALQRAQASAGGTLTPIQTHKVQEVAQQAYSTILRDRKDTSDQSFSQGMTMIANGTPYDQLPITLTSQIQGQDLPRLKEWSDKLNSGKQVTTDLASYNDLVTHPDKMFRMSDAEFAGLQTAFSRADFDRLQKERAGLINGTDSHSPLVLNRAAVNQIVNQNLQQLGIPTVGKLKPEDAARVGFVRQLVDDALIKQQTYTGKQFTPEETSASVSRMFQQQGEVHNWIFPNSSAPLLALRPGDIMPKDRDAIKAAFAAQGIKNPTDQDILGAYQEQHLRAGGFLPASGR